MATISSAGIGSGLDVKNILAQIVKAEREPTENRLNVNEAFLQAELTAYGTLKGAVSSFQSSLSGLKSATGFKNTNAEISNSDVLSVSTSSTAQAGSYSIESKALAQSQTLATAEFSKITDVIGNGTLTINFGTTVYDKGTDTYTSFTQNTETTSKTVVIDSTNNTVSGVRDAINSAGIGVTASIVDNGSGFRLLITSDKQGLENSLEVSIDEGGSAGDNIDGSGLSQLAFNSAATNIEQTQEAQNALITVNGISVSRDSNSITGAIPGVTLNLKSTDLVNPVQLTINDTSNTQAKSNISLFVNGFNEFVSVYNGLTAYAGDNGTNGILLGDSTTRNVMQMIRREFGSEVDNGGAYNGLGSIGISTNRDGTLSLNAEALDKALENDFDSVVQLFNLSGNPSDGNVVFKSSTVDTKEGRYSVSVSSLATQGQLNSQAVSGTVDIDSSNDNFSLSIDGVSTGVINITQASYSDLSSLALEIENQINSDSALLTAGKTVSVAYQSGAFQIISNSYGSDSKVVIAGQNDTLGFNADVISIAGTDVSGTIGGLPAIGSGQILSGSGGAFGLQLEISGNTTGSRGDINFSRGIASQLDVLLTNFQSTGGKIDAKTNSINTQISNIADQRTELIKRVTEIEARYRKEFTALDLLVSQLNSTSEFLQQQLDTLPGVIKRRN